MAPAQLQGRLSASPDSGSASSMGETAGWGVSLLSLPQPRARAAWKPRSASSAPPQADSRQQLGWKLARAQGPRAHVLEASSFRHASAGRKRRGQPSCLSRPAQTRVHPTHGAQGWPQLLGNLGSPSPLTQLRAEQ